MSIIGDQRFRGLSGIAGVSAAHHVVGGANQHHGSRPVSPSHYSRLNSGASQGVLSAPSAASTAVAAGGSAPAGDLDDGTHNDLISTCSALGWTIDELGNFLDKPSGSHHQQQPPNRSYSQHLSQLQLLQQQQQPGGAGDITRCAVLLNRIDEELGRVRAGLGDDEDLLFGSTNPSTNKIANGSVSQYPIGAVAAKKKDEATTFTATRKYAQGSIFERLASIGTEAHPLQQHQLTQGGDALLLAPYQRALSATQGSSSNHLNSTHASAHVVRVPPASSVAAPAVAEPANARWVGGLRSEGPTLIAARQQQAASASANVGGSSVKKGAKIPLVVQRPTITKTETPPTSIWGRLYAIAEKKQQTTSMTAFQEIQHHVIQPPAAAGNNNGHKLNHAAAISKKPAQVNQQQQQQHPKATAALFHRLYEVDTRTKEEARQRKLQEVEAAEQQKVKRERDAIFNRVNRFRETQQFKTQQTTAATSQQQNHRSHSPSSYMHHQHVSSGAVPPLSPMAPSLFTPSIAITSPNHQQGGGGFSRVAATAGGSLGLSPQKSSTSTQQQQQQALRQHAHSWHRAVNSAGAGGHSDALWHISEDDLIPAPSVEGSPTGHHGIGQTTAPPSSMFLPAPTAAGHHPVKYTSKTLPASASHHSRASFETSMNDSHSTLLHTTTSGGNLNFAASINGSSSAAPRRSGKSNNTSPNLRPTAVSLLDDDCDDDDDGAGGSHQLAASFVLTPRGTWQRKQSSSAMHNTRSGIGLTTTQPSTPTPQPPQQVATTSGAGFKTAPIKSAGKRAPTSPLARSVTPSGAAPPVTAVAATTATAPSAPSNSPFSSSINNNRSNSGRVTMLNETTSASLNNTTGGDTVSDLLALQPVGSDGGLARSSSAVSGDGGIPRRNSRSGASHIRTSSYVSATPSPQQPQLLPAAAGSNETPSQSSWNNRRAAAGFAQASSSHEAHTRDASADDYEEVPDRRVSAGGVAGLGLSWSHHPHSNAESPDAPHGSDGHPVTMSLLQDEQAAHHEEEHIEKRPAVAKLDFSKLHAMRKQR